MTTNDSGKLNMGGVQALKSIINVPPSERTPKQSAYLTACLTALAHQPSRWYSYQDWGVGGPVGYLADKGIRCVATDGPTLGGVDPKRALMTYWALGSRGMVGVEYLTSLGTVPPKAYFLFAAARIRGSHGGPGRAIALYSPLNSP